MQVPVLQVHTNTSTYTSTYNDTSTNINITGCWRDTFNCNIFLKDLKITKNCITQTFPNRAHREVLIFWSHKGWGKKIIPFKFMPKWGLAPTLINPAWTEPSNIPSNTLLLKIDVFKNSKPPSVPCPKILSFAIFLQILGLLERIYKWQSLLSTL